MALTSPTPLPRIPLGLRSGHSAMWWVHLTSRFVTAVPVPASVCISNHCWGPARPSQGCARPWFPAPAGWCSQLSLPTEVLMPRAAHSCPPAAFAAGGMGSACLSYLPRGSQSPSTRSCQLAVYRFSKASPTTRNGKNTVTGISRGLMSFH